MTKKIALVVLAVLVPATALAQTTFRTTVRTSHVRVTSGGEIAIQGSDRTGSVRASYLLPVRWRRDSGLTSRSIRFDTRNSCHHKVTFTPRLVQAQDQSAEDRALALVPGTGGFVQASGTREGAAFRVVRQRRTAALTGVLVQPLSKTYSPGIPAGQRVYAEIRARGVADPKLECHSGGPRSVGDAIGDAFAAGQAGGFVHR